MKKKERTILAFTGRTNAGKSSLLNLLSGQKNFAIVDAMPGTTADTVKTVMEIHDFGPAKVFDTAGIDEFSRLGWKKRKKTFEALRESDLIMLVVDLLKAKEEKSFKYEEKIFKLAKKRKKQMLIIYNIFKKKIEENKLKKTAKTIEKKLGFSLPSIYLRANNMSEQRKLVEFIKKYYKKDSRDIDLIPFVADKGYVILNIPMDEETPTLRLLRPQDMAMERLLRKYMIPVLFRMNLKSARSSNSILRQKEKQRFLGLISHLRTSREGLQLIITDSQAMDITSKWVPEGVMLTTFSIMMTNYMSFGNLSLFVEGLKVIPRLKNGDNILVAEACNHDRKAEDIGSVQIPRWFKSKGLSLNFTYTTGRVFPDEEEIKKYKLVIHCGGCMADRQKYAARVWQVQEYNVPITNYGVILSYFQGNRALKKVIEPWMDKTKH